MPDSMQEEVKDETFTTVYHELHFELWILDPFGSSFVLCVCDEDRNVIDSFILGGRYGRLLTVLGSATNERARVEQWRGFLTATTVGERYSALSNRKNALNVYGVRALVSELRRQVKENFAQAARVSRDGLPPIIETRTLVGYRVGASFKTVPFR